ncbi:M61 glycyl aminopeptidase [Phycisphaerae bacterium RAS1]|nr:M61 glycyl aminopeptidase [Phycisphaerae bacterium RAS1]
MLLVLLQTSAAASEVVTYVLKPDPQRGRLHVEVEWSTAGRTNSFLSIAPRFGTVENVPELIENLKFENAAEQARKEGRWELRHRTGAVVRCSYDVESRRRGEWEAVHAPICAQRFFHAIGSTFLLTPESGGGMPEQYDVIIRWELPAGWSAACSWGVGRAVAAPMKPADLRSSVYLAGRLTRASAKSGERTLQVALVDRFGFSAEEFAKRAAEIFAKQCAFAGENGLHEFIVTAVPVGESSQSGQQRMVGSGLYQSFALFLSPDSPWNDGVENLFAHELFHQWNGRALRAREPDELCFWFVEGLTDYYAQRILLDSDLWPAETFARWLNRQLREYAANPARHATNEDIQKNYWSQRDTVGEVAYQRGRLLGVRWHHLAAQHGVADGLDRLFLALLERARQEPTFELTNDLVRDNGVKLLGDWFAAEFERFVIQADTVELPEEALAPRLRGRSQTLALFDLGLDQARTLADRKVRGLKPGSAAERAGLREGEPLAGVSFHDDPDRKVTLRVKRGGRTVTVEYFPRGPQTSVLQFSPAP